MFFNFIYICRNPLCHFQTVVDIFHKRIYCYEKKRLITSTDYINEAYCNLLIRHELILCFSLVIYIGHLIFVIEQIIVVNNLFMNDYIIPCLTFFFLLCKDFFNEFVIAVRSPYKMFKWIEIGIIYFQKILFYLTSTVEKKKELK